MVGSFSSVQPTMCNEYPNEEKEYIFCIKGRPFGCLVSPHLPTPTFTIIDYNLVRDIGMKMSDLQYTKFSFGGQKMRILGKTLKLKALLVSKFRSSSREEIQIVLIQVL